MTEVVQDAKYSEMDGGDSMDGPTLQGINELRNSMQSMVAKENDIEVQSKLYSIQTGKAFLEKKIQEYEVRLEQMKQKKSIINMTPEKENSQNNHKPRFRFWVRKKQLLDKPLQYKLIWIKMIVRIEYK